jgi:hypothetical protein
VAQTPSLLSYLARSFGHVWGFGEASKFSKTLVNLGWWKTGEEREREREREREKERELSHQSMSVMFKLSGTVLKVKGVFLGLI